MARNLRSLLISILALRHGRNLKQVGAVAGMDQKKVSFYLRKEEMEDDIFERLLAGTKCRPAEIPLVTGCLESLDFLEGGQGSSRRPRSAKRPRPTWPGGSCTTCSGRSTTLSCCSRRDLTAR